MSRAYTNRCSPKAILKVIHKLNGRHEEDIRRAGFGFVYDIADVCLDRDYIKNYVMGSYCPGFGLFDGLKLLPSDVRAVFDLPDSGIVIEDISATRKEELKIKWGGWTLGRLKDDLVRDQETEDFMEKFVLFVLGNFLCPTTKDKPSEELFRVLPVIPESRAHNWGKFIVDWTVQQADQYYFNIEQNSIGGCTYFLMILFFQKMSPIPMQGNTPLIKLWNKDMIKRALQIPLTNIYTRPRRYYILGAASEEVFRCAVCDNPLRLTCGTCQETQQQQQRNPEPQTESTIPSPEHHQRADEGQSVKVKASPLIARVLEVEFSPSPQEPVQDENNVLLGRRIRKPPTPRFEQEFNQPPTNTKTQRRRRKR